MPREVERIGRICSLLEQLWGYHQEMGFCQLLATHLFVDALAGPLGDIWFKEDSKLEEILVEKVSTFQKMRQNSLKLSDSQIEILNGLKKLWEKQTDQRLGQLLSNYIVGHVSDHPPGQMLSLSDAQVLQQINY